MTIPNSTFRVFSQKLGGTDSSQFVGNEGDIFWNPNTGELKVSNGSTPGGVAVTGAGGTGGVSQSYVDNKVGLSTAELASEAYVNQQIAAPITQSLIPDTDNAYDLGSSTKQWREFYVTSDTMYVGGIPIGVNTEGRLTVNKEPLAKLAELNEDRIEELQNAMITMQAVYNGQIQSLTQKITSLPKTVHASWNSSAAGSFDWSTDEISSSGVTSVTRQGKGIYRITFSEDFSSTNYTITTGVGSNDYGGTGASPRGVSVLLESRTTSSVDVICERTDDAVNEDNAYMSIIIMGT